MRALSGRPKSILKQDSQFAYCDLQRESGIIMTHFPMRVSTPLFVPAHMRRLPECDASPAPGCNQYFTRSSRQIPTLLGVAHDSQAGMLALRVWMCCYLRLMEHIATTVGDEIYVTAPMIVSDYVYLTATLSRFW